MIETDRRNAKLLPSLDLDEVFMSRIFDLASGTGCWEGASAFEYFARFLMQRTLAQVTIR